MSGKRAAGAALRTYGIVLIVLVLASALSVTGPKLLGLASYSVLSGSMEPAIPTGSLVYIEPAEPESLSEGDVAAFRDQLGNTVVHRVVRNKLVEGELVTKGDANASNDMNPISYDDVMGRVALHVPFLGRLAVLYSDGVGRLGAFCILALGALLDALGSRLRRQYDDRSVEGIDEIPSKLKKARG